jgi:hypothetical protein
VIDLNLAEETLIQRLQYGVGAVGRRQVGGHARKSVQGPAP